VYDPITSGHQLAHSVRDPNGRAYNRTAHLPERIKMMQQWSDYLDSLKDETEVSPVRHHPNLVGHFLFQHPWRGCGKRSGYRREWTVCRRHRRPAALRRLRASSRQIGP